MPRRVLYLHAHSELGGSQISIITLIRHLDPDRYVSKILVSDAGPFLDLASSFGINAAIQEFAYLSRRRPWVYGRSLFHLMRTIETERIDLVHMNCVRSLLYASKVCLLLRIPYVFHVRDARQPWFEPNALMALNQSKGVIANSSYISRICHEKGVSPDLIKLVYNPIDMVPFSNVNDEPDSDLRASLGIPPGVIVFGFVGRLHAIKGPDLFIKASLEVLKSLPDAHFIIAGKAEEQNYLHELRALLTSSALAARMYFLGFRLDVASVMRTADVLVVPSRDEPFGRVVVEAMACGCPVICSSTGGLVEIVTDELDGLLVPPDSVDPLAEAMGRLARDAGLRERLSQEGRRTAAKFAPEKHALTIQALYDEVLNAPRP